MHTVCGPLLLCLYCVFFVDSWDLFTNIPYTLLAYQYRDHFEYGICQWESRYYFSLCLYGNHKIVVRLSRVVIPLNRRKGVNASGISQGHLHCQCLFCWGCCNHCDTQIEFKSHEFLFLRNWFLVTYRFWSLTALWGSVQSSKIAWKIKCMLWMKDIS